MGRKFSDPSFRFGAVPSDLVLPAESETGGLGGVPKRGGIDLSTIRSSFQSTFDGRYAFASDLSSLTSRVTTAENEIDALQSDVGTIEAELTDLEGRVTVAENAITGLQVGYADHETRIDALEALIDPSLETRIDALEAADIVIDGRLDALEAYDLTVETRLDDLEADVADHETRITTLEGAAPDLSDAVILAPTTSTRNLIQADDATVVPLQAMGDVGQSADLFRLGLWNGIGWTTQSVFDESGRLAIGYTDPGTDMLLVRGSSVDFQVLATGVPQATQYDVNNSANLDLRLQAEGLRLRSSGTIGFSSTGAASGSVDAAIERSAAGRLAIADGASALADLELDDLFSDHVETVSIDLETLSSYSSTDLKATLVGGVLSLASDARIDFSSTSLSSGTKDLGIVRDDVATARLTNGSTGYGAWRANAYRVHSTAMDAFLGTPGLGLKDTGKITWSSTSAADGAVAKGLELVSSILASTDGAGGLEDFAGAWAGFERFTVNDAGDDPNAPPFTKSSDDDSGFFFPAANQCGIACGGSEVARFGGTYSLQVTSGLRIGAGGFFGSTVSQSPSSGTTNNYPITPALVVDIDTSAGNATLTGISVSGAVSGQLMLITKSGNNSLTLNHADTASSVGNRFAMAGGVNISVTAAHHLILLQYTGTVWRAGRLAP